jgi:hypothetical protein
MIRRSLRPADKSDATISVYIGLIAEKLRGAIFASGWYPAAREKLHRVFTYCKKLAKKARSVMIAR